MSMIKADATLSVDETVSREERAGGSGVQVLAFASCLPSLGVFAEATLHLPSTLTLVPCYFIITTSHHFLLPHSNPTSLFLPAQSFTHPLFINSTKYPSLVHRHPPSSHSTALTLITRSRSRFVYFSLSLPHFHIATHSQRQDARSQPRSSCWSGVISRVWSCSPSCQTSPSCPVSSLPTHVMHRNR
jgi:hypothetical protein